jgi:hypothetical protein
MGPDAFLCITPTFHYCIGAFRHSLVALQCCNFLHFYQTKYYVGSFKVRKNTFSIGRFWYNSRFSLHAPGEYYLCWFALVCCCNFLNNLSLGNRFGSMYQVPAAVVRGKISKKKLVEAAK